MCMYKPLQQLQVYASAARTASPTVPEFENTYAYNGVIVTIDCTAATSTPSVVFTLQTYDEKAEDWFDLIASSAVTATGNTIIGTFAGGTATANSTASFHPGKRVRVKAVHADSDSITYSVTLHWVGW